MRLKLNGKTLDKYNNVAVSLIFDAVADAFSFTCYYDPNNENDRALFVPGAYNTCEVYNNNELLITGVCTSQKMESSAQKHLIQVGGYSRTGILEHVMANPEKPIDYTNMTLRELCNALMAPFGLQAFVDPTAADIADQPLGTAATLEPNMTLKDFLTTIGLPRLVIFTHDEKGNLVIARAAANKKPIYNFEANGLPVIKKSLHFGGDAMHSVVWAVGQAGGDENNMYDSFKNPYVLSKKVAKTFPQTDTIFAKEYETGYRPGVYIQQWGTDVITPLTARQYVGNELKGVRLTIDIEGWTLNGQIVKPNNIVTVTDPELGIFKKSKWLIERVDFYGDHIKETATIHCVLPECYTKDAITNIFL